MSFEYKKSYFSITQILVFAFITLALAHINPCSAQNFDLYDDAEDSAKNLLNRYDDFKKLTKLEIEALVKAIYEANEEERKSVSSDIGARVQSKVRSEHDETEKQKNNALEMLKIVLDDPSLESKHSDAERLKSEVEEKWKSIDKMYDSLRGSNHPVVSYMLDKGKEEDDYRKGRCSASQVDTGNGYADCVGYDGNSCLIVEFKPNNSKSISKGQQQLRDYKSGLENNASKRQDLNNKHSSFATCGTFETRIDCYKLAPEIEDDGNFKTRSTEWSTDCR